MTRAIAIAVAILVEEGITEEGVEDHCLNCCCCIQVVVVFKERMRKCGMELPQLLYLSIGTFENLVDHGGTFQTVLLRSPEVERWRANLEEHTTYCWSAGTKNITYV